MKPIVIIPAFEPDEKLLGLAEALSTSDLPVVVVNDGSRPEYQPIFDTLESKYGYSLCRHPVNMGKGAALKTGIRYAAEHFPESSGYITADADGQHSVKDILKVAEALENHPGSLVIGTRDFNQKAVPFKSRWGNRITSFVFRLSTGRRCSDTQTGLRGIPKQFTELCLSIPENRYEYEMNLLLKMSSAAEFLPVPISTIYLEHNRASHFHAVRDSLRIYANLIKYSCVSLFSAGLDLAAFALLTVGLFGSGTRGILTSTVIARLLSGGLNFTLNKHWVFRSKNRSSIEAWRYLALFCCQMLLSWLLVTSLSSLPLPLALIKLLVDSALFFLSFHIQRKYIFRGKMRGWQSTK